MIKKAVVLLSGGLDSTTCLAIAQHHGFTCYALSFQYQQKHAAELIAAQNIATAYSVAAHHIMPLNLGIFGGSALTDAAIDIPDYSNNNGKNSIPITYVPARNTMFLAIALGLAEVVAAEAIFIGVNAIDYSGYPDCRPEYIMAFQKMANLATKTSVDGKTITIETPLLKLNKAAIIQQGCALGVDYALTVSCYRATDAGLACGNCDSCTFRRQGFIDAAVIDPTRYI